MDVSSTCAVFQLRLISSILLVSRWTIWRFLSTWFINYWIFVHGRNYFACTTFSTCRYFMAGAVFCSYTYAESGSKIQHSVDPESIVYNFNPAGVFIFIFNFSNVSIFMNLVSAVSRSSQFSSHNTHTVTISTKTKTWYYNIFLSLMVEIVWNQRCSTILLLAVSAFGFELGLNENVANDRLYDIRAFHEFRTNYDEWVKRGCTSSSSLEIFFLSRFSRTSTRSILTLDQKPADSQIPVPMLFQQSSTNMKECVYYLIIVNYVPLNKLLEIIFQAKVLSSTHLAVLVILI